MQLFSQNDKYKLYQGNMLDMLEVIEPNSIDSIITDPPYELNFMGKGWDNSGIAFQPNTWQKCYEVLKPGGYLLAFGGSRTFHRIACAIEDAGFEIRDIIMWLYGSGFPKSMDISKQIDKRNGKQNEDFTKFGNYVKQCRETKGYSKNDIDKIMETNTACAWWEGRIYKDDFIVQLPDKENYYKLKEILDMNNDFDYLIEWQEAEREVIGQKEKLESYQYKGNNVYQTNGDKEKITLDITTPATDLAKQWQGWGTALKPSFEPIIVARKPFKGSLVDNVIEYGVGGINIDECRVEYEKTTNPATNPLYRQQNADKYKQVQGGELSNGAVSWTSGKNGVSEMGRFPANTILTYDETDFDEVCGGFPNTKSGIAVRHNSGGNTFGGNNKKPPMEDLGYNDSGSASRYFYCAKASKKDRDEGLDTFEEKLPACLTDFRPTLATNPEKWNNGEPVDYAMMRTKPRKNIHPTVKPTELMQYLIKLVTPNNGTVLDPFNGSGSTGKAVMYENKEHNKNYKYIGIELTEEYLPIAKARIEYVCELNEDELKDKQLTIFDIKEE